MRPILHPTLVNGRSGDPALYVETLFERRAILFDLGDISTLAARKILRLEHVFVSHTHIDHFIGFDHMLRLLVGRDQTVNLYGPPGFIDHVHHKLQSYRWNLVDRFEADLRFIVTEIEPSMKARTARFRLKNAFAAEALGADCLREGVLCQQPGFRVSTTVLEHRTPCLAFAIQETAHVNVWKNRLEELGLPVGSWLRELKRAVVENRPDDDPVRVDGNRTMRLGDLRSVVTVTPGQKIGYVTDAAGTDANRSAIIQLVRNADLLFIEAAFARADAALAAERAHLTTTAAGEIAREAAARRVEPFHFSPRYAGAEQRLLDEVREAFGGQRSPRSD
jgi:ribonuclease Z